jgi:hypothetical protein
MEVQQNTELVKECYAAYARGDLPHLLACMAPQVEWELPAVPGLGFTGKRQGCDSVADYFRESAERQTVRAMTPHDFVAQGDKVVVLGHGAWTAKDTGRDFESDWVHVFTIKDGRVTAFREFMDANVAAEAFQCYPMAEVAVRPASLPA